MSRSGFVNVAAERGRLFALVGLPHSGKSTYANTWARECKQFGTSGPHAVVQRPRVVIAGDDFRHALYGSDYISRAEHVVFTMMDTAIAALLLRGFDVLVDETSTSKPTLMRYLRLDPACELIFIDTPADECKRRAIANNKPELIRVIDRLAPRLANLKTNWCSIRAELLPQVEHLLVS